MSERTVFQVTAGISALVGLLLVLGTWDGLYEALDLPQALPALGPQIGGIAILALAFLIWSASTNPELRRPMARAAAFVYLGSAAVIAAWLIFRDKADLQIGDGGWVVLIVLAVIFAGLGASLVRAARA